MEAIVVTAAEEDATAEKAANLEEDAACEMMASWKEAVEKDAKRLKTM